jgi:hypothetical protein
MPDSPIHLSYQWTAKELLRAQHYQLRHILTPYFRPVLFAFSTLILLVGVALMALSFGIGTADGETDPKLRELATFLVVAGLFAFVMPVVRRWRVKRQFAMRPDCNCQCDWTIEPSGITVTTPISTATSSWKTIIKVVQSPDGFLIFKGPNMFQWLRRHAFASDPEVEQFAKMARARVPRFYEVA